MDAHPDSSPRLLPEVIQIHCHAHPGFTTKVALDGVLLILLWIHSPPIGWGLIFSSGFLHHICSGSSYRFSTVLLCRTPLLTVNFIGDNSRFTAFSITRLVLSAASSISLQGRVKRYVSLYIALAECKKKHLLNGNCSHGN